MVVPEIAIISLNGIACAVVRIGGDAFDEAIITYVRRRYGCLIGEATAERIKTSIATAFPTTEDLQMEISGRLVSEGVPRSFILRSSEVLEALTEPLTGIITAFVLHLNKCLLSYLLISTNEVWCSVVVALCSLTSTV